MPEELVKLLIETDIPGAQPIKVLFNPSEYSIEDSNTWEEQKRNKQRPELQFTAQSLKKLSMELFFDSYENKGNQDVRQFTRQIANLLEVGTGIDKDRPPVCTIFWGDNNSTTPNEADFPFIGVLESLKQQFVLFNSVGTPIRARLSVSFKQFLLPEEELKRKPRKSSFPANTYTVVLDDTLSGIAARLWEKPEEWRRIANGNNIINPRILRPGQVLIIPPIED
ncbi:MAG: LysM peptidoglycan-binding domain-containing protein [Deltaproteobacteria bacterium]|nr:LysM peptidoglycan-binding domain-containing protein [Deltaproteobacteria bacterium]